MTLGIGIGWVVSVFCVCVLFDESVNVLDTFAGSIEGYIEGYIVGYIEG